MPLYVSDYIGSGTLTDPFRPRGSDQPGWSAIDLRADGGATLDGNGLKYCLLYLPVADNDPRLYKVADVKGENLTLTIRAGLAARLNATINYTRFDDIVADLLLRPPTNSWKALQDHPTRQLAIHLGGLLSPSPAIRSLAAQTYSETWTAADSGSISADLTWTEILGTALAISGNRLRLTGTAAGNHIARAEHALDTDDMIVQMTIPTMTVVGNITGAGVIARKDTSATVTCYLYGPYKDAGSSGHNLIKYNNAAETLLTVPDPSDPTDWTANEVIALLCDGSSITGYLQGAVSAGPVTDTAIAGNKYAGVRVYSNNASNVVEADDWQARDYEPRPLVMVMSPLRW